MIANIEKEALWRGRVAQWRDSGLSQRAFGIQQGHPQRQLSDWVRRLSARDTTPALVPVEIKPGVSAAPAVSLRSPSGWTMLLPPDLPARWVAARLRAPACKPNRSCWPHSRLTCASAPPTCSATAAAKAGNEFALEFATRMQVDGVVDRLVGHRFFRIVGPKAPEFARNLLRRSEEF